MSKAATTSWFNNMPSESEQFDHEAELKKAKWHARWADKFNDASKTKAKIEKTPHKIKDTLDSDPDTSKTAASSGTESAFSKAKKMASKAKKAAKKAKSKVEDTVENLKQSKEHKQNIKEIRKLATKEYTDKKLTSDTFAKYALLWATWTEDSNLGNDYIKDTKSFSELLSTIDTSLIQKWNDILNWKQEYATKDASFDTTSLWFATRVAFLMYKEKKTSMDKTEITSAFKKYFEKKASSDNEQYVDDLMTKASNVWFFTNNKWVYSLNNKSNTKTGNKAPSESDKKNPASQKDKSFADKTKDWLAKAAEDTATGFRAWVTMLGTWAKNLFSDLWSWVRWWWKLLWTWTKNVLTEAWTWIKEWGRMLWRGWKTVIWDSAWGIRNTLKAWPWKFSKRLNYEDPVLKAARMKKAAAEDIQPGRADNWRGLTKKFFKKINPNNKNSPKEKKATNTPPSTRSTKNTTESFKDREAENNKIKNNTSKKPN